MTQATTMDESSVAPGARKPAWRTAIMISVPLLLIALGAWFWLTSGRYVETDNAYVQQDKVSVAAEINGTIAEVLVAENQPVKKGELLFRIDPRPYRIALDEADAQIAQARVQVGQLRTQSAGTGADIEGAARNLTYAQSNYERYSALMDRGFTTRVRFDEARHDVEEARERLANARAEAATAQAALFTGGGASQPAIEAARVARERALLNLARTEVRAPSDGLVSQTDRLQVGAAVVTGAPMVTIVRSGDAWIEANYKETDLADMFVGQPAEVELDAYPGVKVHGRVASIGAGTGAEFSVLPAQNATGNWVKVTQRVPVRIAIDGTPERPLIAGLSADVSIDTARRPTQRMAARN